jgi:hypothetical protein
MSFGLIEKLKIFMSVSGPVLVVAPGLAAPRERPAILAQRHISATRRL